MLHCPKIISPLLLVCAILAFPNPLAAQITFTNAFTTASMGQNCIAGSPTSSFDLGQGAVWVWYQYLQGGQKGDVGAVQWIGPSGKVEVSFPWGPAPSSYGGTYCWDIAIGTGTPLGRWSVQLVTNGVVNFSLGFTISSTSSGQTWIQLNPTGQTPPISAGVNVANSPYDAVNSRLIVFGGGSSSTWVLSNANGLGGTPIWTQLSPTGSLPPPRTNSTNVYDAANNRLIIFGGSGNNQQLLNDAWVLSNANGLGGTPQWTQLPAAGTKPSPRGDPSGAYDPSSNRLILFGGCTGADSSNCRTLLGDTWILTNANGLGGTPQWSQLATVGSVQSRVSQSAVYDPAANKLIVFGGSEPGCNVTNDGAILSNANGLGNGSPTWNAIPATGGPPKYNHAAAYDAANDRLIVFAGVSSSSVCGVGAVTNDVWTLIGVEGKFAVPRWLRLNPSVPLPTAREGATGAYDPVSNRLIVFGGGAFTDTWVLTNANGGTSAVSLSPTMGLNTRSTTVTFVGSPLLKGAQVTLSAPGLLDIPGSSISNPGPSVLLATFDLTGAAPGLRDAVMTSGSNAITLPSAFTVASPASCSYSLSPAGQKFGNAGGSASFVVTSMPPQCPWTATANDPWINLLPVPIPQNCTVNGCAGNPVVSYQAAANQSGVDRSGTITIANQNGTSALHTIFEAGSACTYSLSQSSQAFSPSGGSVTFHVAAQGNCAWNTVNSLNWITVQPGSGSGAGSVSISAAANSGGARSGALAVAGQTFSVSQPAGQGSSVCGATDVSGKIGVEQGPMQFVPSGNAQVSQYQRKITLKNNSSQAVAGPIYLVLDGLPYFDAGSCKNGCGLSTTPEITHCNSPSATGSSLVLWSAVPIQPGVSITFIPGFTGPGTVVGGYSTRVLSGKPNQ
jgi:hypothetical protein